MATSTQELKQEVALRQRLVLAPGPAGSAMPIHERQRKLRYVHKQEGCGMQCVVHAPICQP